MRKKTNEEFQEELRQLQNKGYDVYTDDVYDGNKSKIWFYCSKGHRWETNPNSILIGGGCPYCSNKKVLIGYNDLWTTNPDIARLLKNPDDGYKYTRGSNKKVEFICSNCKSIVKKTIVDVSSNGIICPMCSDGVSYPNKLIRQVMKQLNVNFIPEYVAPWSKLKMYDCYFVDKNGQEYVIEMDGVQHYIDNCMPHQTLKEIQENDKLKTNLANDNGVVMIRIDCLKSNLEYIKNNILSSKLNDIFDLSIIDWNLCDINAQNNLVREACNLYMSGINRTKDIAKILHIHRTTACRYLKRGAKFGWCDYDVKKTRNKPIIAINNTSGEMFYFDGVHICQDKMYSDYGIKVQAGRICESCKTGKVYKGFIFKHVDFNNTKLIERGVEYEYTRSFA